MSKKQIFGINTSDLIKFGSGKEGVVYIAPENRILKVYLNESRCKSEYKMLKSLEDNKHFPKVFACKGRFMIREFVNGVPIIEYIKENGLSKKLAKNLINLADDFENIQYLKVDGIDNHIYVLKNEKVMVIDPRRRKYKLYKSLMAGLERIGELENFENVLRKKRPDLALKWLKK